MKTGFKHLGGLSVRQRATFGARGGLRLGAYLAVLAALAAALSNPRAHLILAPVALAAAVLLGIMVGGVIFAVGRPWIRDSYGAALLGAAALAPTLFASRFAASGWAMLTWRGALRLAAVAFVVGGLLGIMAWRGWSRQSLS